MSAANFFVKDSKIFNRRYLEGFCSDSAVETWKMTARPVRSFWRPLQLNRSIILRDISDFRFSPTHSEQSLRQKNILSGIFKQSLGKNYFATDFQTVSFGKKNARNLKTVSRKKYFATDFSNSLFWQKHILPGI